MKMKLTRPDGSVAEVEGTPEECATFAGAMTQAKPAEGAEMARRAAEEASEAYRKALYEILRAFPWGITFNPPPVYVPYLVPYIQPINPPPYYQWGRPYWQYPWISVGSVDGNVPCGIQYGDPGPVFPGVTNVSSLQLMEPSSTIVVDSSLPMTGSSFVLRPSDQISYTVGSVGYDG